MIKGGNATIYVSDMDRAVEFYTETLGLTLKFRSPGWSEVAAGGTLTIGLHQTHPGGPEPGASGSISIGFELDQPLDDVYAALKEKGVPFRGPVNEGGAVRLAFFGDPDGNSLYFSEAKVPAPS